MIQLAEVVNEAVNETANEAINWHELKEKTVQGLKCCGSSYDTGDCRNCPYDPDCAVGIGDRIYDDALKLIEEYDKALKLMVYQYCTDVYANEEIFSNRQELAGEQAFELLGIKNFCEVPDDWPKGRE